jgi:hypothetical protein
MEEVFLVVLPLIAGLGMGWCFVMLLEDWWLDK